MPRVGRLGHSITRRSCAPQRAHHNESARLNQNFRRRVISTPSRPIRFCSLITLLVMSVYAHDGESESVQTLMPWTRPCGCSANRRRDARSGHERMGSVRAYATGRTANAPLLDRSRQFQRYGLTRPFVERCRRCEPALPSLLPAIELLSVRGNCRAALSPATSSRLRQTGLIHEFT